MLLLDRKAAHPGNRPAVWLSYQPQPQLKLVRLSCGFSVGRGRSAGGVKVVRTKGATSTTHKFWPLFPTSRGFFTLSLIVL